MAGEQKSFDSDKSLGERLDINFALKAAGLGVWEIDPITWAINWSEQCRALFNLDRDSQIPYEQLILHIHYDDRGRVDQALRRALSSHIGGGFDVTFRTLEIDAVLNRWVRFMGQAYFNEAGDPYRFAGVAQQVDNRYQRQQLSLLVENAPEFMATTDLEGRMQFINKYGLALFGLTPDQVAGRFLTDFVPPEEMDRVHTEILPSVMRGNWSGTVVLMQPETKLRIPVWCDAYLLIDPTSDQPYGIAGVIRDRRPELAAQQALVTSEARFRSIIEQTPAPTLVVRGDDYIVEQINDPMIALMGQGKEAIGKPLLVLMPELEYEFAWKQVQRAYKEGISYTGLEIQVRHSTAGQINGRYYNLAYNPLWEDDRITGMIQVVTEVTTQVLARQKTEEAEMTLRGAIELAELETWSFDLAARVLTYSDRLRDWFGIGPDELITVERGYQPIREMDLPRIKAAFVNAITPGTDGIYQLEYTLEADKTGQKRIVQARGKAYFNEHGEAYKISGTVRDVTQQRLHQLALENQVHQRTQELEAINEEYASINEELTESNGMLSRSNDNLEQFAYVASHDLQEPLRKVQQFGDLLKNQYGPQLGDGLVYLERMQSAASRMSTLIRDLLSFSRISTRQELIGPVSLKDVVNMVLMDLELVIQETGAVVTVAVLPTVSGDRSQLTQLFQNLLSNALKFRQVGIIPLIQVSTQVLSASDLPVSVKPVRAAADYHRIDVSDNGIGFDEKYLSRIFQVFQRLHGKSEFAGTGIGLAISEKVAITHGGAISATSQPGQGATFSVYLPIQPG